MEGKLIFFIVNLIFPFSGASTPPNILLIVADDLGYNDVSWHNPDIISPHLGKLASNGMILESHYTMHVCTPTRAALMTSYYPIHTGRQHETITQQEPVGVYTNFTFMPEYFKQIGYKTHAVGKWHLGFCSENYIPTGRGFDTFYGFYTGSEDYYTHMRGSSVGEKGPGYDFRDQEEADWAAQGIYSSKLLGKRTADIIQDHAENYSDDPFYIYLPFQDVHAPIMVPKEYEDMYPNVKNESRRILSGMVTAMDDAVGQIVEALEQTKMLDKTIIVFTPDNGGQCRKGGNNHPLKGNKNTLWEGGTRSAAFIYSSLLKNKGSLYDGLIHVVDWGPTLLSAVKEHLSQPQHDLVNSWISEDKDGMDLWNELIKGEASKRTEFLYNIDPLFDDGGSSIIGGAGIRVGDMKLLIGNPGDRYHGHFPPDEVDPENICPPGQGGDGIDNLDKMSIQMFSDIFSIADTEVYLYNIKEDPNEYHNIAKDNPTVVEELKEKLKVYYDSMIPPNIEEQIEEGNPSNFNGTFASGWCKSEPTF